MDVNKLTIYYGCYYCKKGFHVFKSSLIEHWNKGCKQMRDCFSTWLILKPASNLK